MGSSCSHSLDAWAHLATTQEVRDAVRSIEAWQKAQEQNKATGGANRMNSSSGPLLQRVGGVDMVKRVVEGFYRRLYADERLNKFLYDKDIMYLRAKQSAFMSWLFGPSNLPYNGKNLRTAHLRIIKERGFSSEDFDLGMRYFEAAMRELEAPDNIITEVLTKIKPFKDVIFTPTAKDAEEEARWAFESRVRESNKNLDMGSLGRPSIGTNPSVKSYTSIREPQCPFTGGRLSGQASTASAGEVAVVVPPAMSTPGPAINNTALAGKPVPPSPPSQPRSRPGSSATAPNADAAAAALSIATAGNAASKPVASLASLPLVASCPAAASNPDGKVIRTVSSTSAAAVPASAGNAVTGAVPLPPSPPIPQPTLQVGSPSGSFRPASAGSHRSAAATEVTLAGTAGGAAPPQALVRSLSNSQPAGSCIPSRPTSGTRPASRRSADNLPAEASASAILDIAAEAPPVVTSVVSGSPEKDASLPSPSTDGPHGKVVSALAESAAGASVMPLRKQSEAAAADIVDAFLTEVFPKAEDAEDDGKLMEAALAELEGGSGSVLQQAAERSNASMNTRANPP